MKGAFLLDTSVVSLIAPDRPALPESFAGWLRAQDKLLFLSAVTVLEIEQGIRRLRRAGGNEPADRLTAWLERLVETYGERVVSVDSKVARLAGAIADAAVAIGRHPGLADVMIAATAQCHNLLLLTRDGKHFAPLGVEHADPLSEPPH